MDKKRIIQTDLIERQKPKSREEAQTSAILGGKNLSYLGGFAHQAIFNGLARRPSKYDIRWLREGNGRFEPDHVQVSNGNHLLTEIKTSCGNNPRPFCPARQFCLYSQALLDHLEDGEETPDFRYAFYTYGGRRPEGLTKVSNHNLVRLFSKQVKSLLVVPHNLAMFLFMSTDDVPMDQGNHRPGSGNVIYWRPLGTDLTTLRKHSPEEAIGKIESRATKKMRISPFQYLSREELSLDDLQARTFVSPTNLQFASGRRAYNITPFPITVYENIDQRAWLERFRANHESFYEAMGLDPKSIAELKEKAKPKTGKVPF